jgi:DNA-binding SARP family transcriptional activator
MTSLSVVTSSPTVTLQVLGRVRLEVEGTAVDVGPGVAELLALLGIRGATPRRVVCSSLWPDASPETGRSRLRSLVYRTRQVARFDAVVQSPTDNLDLARGIAVDYRGARASADRLGRGANRGPGSPAVDDLADIVDLVTPALMPDHTAEWLAPYQVSWAHQRLRTLEACAERALELGASDTAVRASEEVLLTEPFCEQAHYLLIRALVQEGFWSQAHHCYLRMQRLVAELGCPPAKTFSELAFAGGATAEVVTLST